MTKPRVRILYCPGCRWLPRAAWQAQELLTTFEQELGEVALVPAARGTYEVWVDEQRLFSRAEEGGFPGLRLLKQRLRDQIAPARDLGHSDR